MSEPIQHNMHVDKPTSLISLHLNDEVIERLKHLAPSLGFKDYEALIRAYISRGLRNHLAQREAHRTKQTTIEEFSRRLMAHGVSPQAIKKATTDMKTWRFNV